MPCMCGDLYCFSCGPAQGNYHCPVCGVWTADGGCANPQSCKESARKMDEESAKQEAELSAAAEQYWAEESARWEAKRNNYRVVCACGRMLPANILECASCGHKFPQPETLDAMRRLMN